MKLGLSTDLHTFTSWLIKIWKTTATWLWWSHHPKWDLLPPNYVSSIIQDVWEGEEKKEGRDGGGFTGNINASFYYFYVTSFLSHMVHTECPKRNFTPLWSVSYFTSLCNCCLLTSTFIMELTLFELCLSGQSHTPHLSAAAACLSFITVMDFILHISLQLLPADIYIHFCNFIIQLFVFFPLFLNFLIQLANLVF